MKLTDRFNELRESCLKCTKCNLHETRTNVVFGVGDSNADIMFVGEGPGQNEDLTGEPFVGRAGKLLDKMLEAIDLSREKVYIANIVKCRPPNNRDPSPVEQDACIGYLYKQIELINPKIIVCLGRISGQVLIKKDLKITKEHGIVYRKDSRMIMATFHPAALLRNPHQTEGAFADFLRLRDIINDKMNFIIYDF